MRKLAVFSLSAVIQFQHSLMQALLVQTIEKIEGIALTKTEPPGAEVNIHKLIMALYKEAGLEEPSAERQAKIEKQLNKELKKEFLKEEEFFEVRPGVQNIFNHLEKRKNWKYCILSPYWNSTTHAILQLCGVYSKNKFTITASQALSAQEQLEIAISRSKKKNLGIKVLLINEQLNITVKPEYITLQPKNKGKGNYFAYPKFSELFKPVL